jgi:hypothetical protein
LVGADGGALVVVVGWLVVVVDDRGDSGWLVGWLVVVVDDCGDSGWLVGWLGVVVDDRGDGSWLVGSCWLAAVVDFGPYESC